MGLSTSFHLPTTSLGATTSASGVLLLPYVTHQGLRLHKTSYQEGVQSAKQTAVPTGSKQPFDQHHEALLLAPMSLLWPALSTIGQSTYNSLQPSNALQPGCSLHVILNEQPPDLPQTYLHDCHAIQDHGKQHILPAQLLGSFPCPHASSSLQSAIKAASASSRDWKLGWALSPHQKYQTHPSGVGPETGTSSKAVHSKHELHTVKLREPTIGVYTTFAVFSVQMHADTYISLYNECSVHTFLNPDATSLNQRPTSVPAPGGAGVTVGDAVQVVGSPFGCLAPSHFINCIIQGCVSAILPPAPSSSFLSDQSLQSGETANQSGQSQAIVWGAQPTQIESSSVPTTLIGPSPPWHQHRAQAPVGLLCCPLTRTSDGSQLHLAVSWQHIQIAFAAWWQKQQLSGAVRREPPMSAAAAAAPVIQGFPSFLLSSRLLAGGNSSSALHGNKKLEKAKLTTFHHNTTGLPNSRTIPNPPGKSDLNSEVDVHNESPSRAILRPQLLTSPLGSSKYGTCISQDSSLPGKVTHCHLMDVLLGRSQPEPGFRSQPEPGFRSQPEPGFRSQPDPLERALQGVVMVRSEESWATGILISQSGLILTNAHLFTQQRSYSTSHREASMASTSHASASAEYAPTATSSPPKQMTAPTLCSVRILISHAGPHFVWLTANIVYVFQNHLDIAVLQLEGVRQHLPSLQLYPIKLPCYDAPSTKGRDEGQHSQVSCTGSPASTLAFHTSFNTSATPMMSSKPPSSMKPTNKCMEPSTSGDITIVAESAPGSPLFRPPTPPAEEAVSSALCGNLVGRKVLVLGHGLFGPNTAWPATATSGSICKVVYSNPGRPAMLITTAAVHSGASGAVVMDPASGTMLGIVTSNARHHAGKGATLPRLNFCIASSELAPIIRWAQRVSTLAGEGFLWYGPNGGSAPVASVWLRELQAIDCKDDRSDRVWQLRNPDIKEEEAFDSLATNGKFMEGHPAFSFFQSSGSHLLREGVSCRHVSTTTRGNTKAHSEHHLSKL
ncbi:hypothetical protein CEUSTIGMA_g6648.t1 [Chlamydomonas eustigma]|uniref:Glyoxysomal processing protease, glyoxysomal n=1 Tax=Chlamydomonas eustigma TaxID=1157962 RepID=A0A250X7Z6_9CHLO|nr:hypothetical protein CEUSTIGMA_g6648.t1 [Chlamydomonas eustigma]|eukprot:GAX79208.1 hypothetical protein CEUSTIGMA_g6648.t1 [Chlamydomonas eustigma]